MGDIKLLHRETDNNVVKKHVVIIDDFDDSFLRELLVSEGFSVTYIDSGTAALEHIKTKKSDIILLDLSLPEINGFELLKEITNLDYFIPVIIVSAKSSTDVKVATLNMGAVDYVTKPYHYEELIARVKVNLKKKSIQPDLKQHTHQFHSFTFNLKNLILTDNGSQVPLSHIEAQLLKLLITQNGDILTREEIAGRIWGSKIHVTSKAIDVQISRLRKKIKDDPEDPKHIITVYGIGYKFIF